MKYFIFSQDGFCAIFDWKKIPFKTLKLPLHQKKKNWKKLFFKMKFYVCLPSNWLFILPSKQQTFHMFYITGCKKNKSLYHESEWSIQMNSLSLRWMVYWLLMAALSDRLWNDMKCLIKHTIFYTWRWLSKTLTPKNLVLKWRGGVQELKGNRITCLSFSVEKYHVILKTSKCDIYILSF